jgi:hypothetical protein
VPQAVATKLVHDLRAHQQRIITLATYRISQIGRAGDEPTPETSPILRNLVAVGFEYSLEKLSCDDEYPPSIPDALLSDAKSAARRGVGIELVVRRYVAGHSAFRDLILNAAAPLYIAKPEALYALLRNYDSVFDLLLASITATYEQEAKQFGRSSNQRRVDRVVRLLRGEAIDPSKLGYDLNLSHLGLIAIGTGATTVIRGLAAAFDRTCLTVSPDDLSVWAWLGGRQRIDVNQVKEVLSTKWSLHLKIAIGEPCDGFLGWRTTHQQARSCLAAALHMDDQPFCYSDKPLLAAVLANNLHADSLYDIFLAPLEQTRDGGERLRETLRAYFATHGNVSASAERLKVSRRTIHSRLNLAKDLLNRPLDSYSAEIETALHLYDLIRVSPTERALSSPSGGPKQDLRRTSVRRVS